MFKDRSKLFFEQRFCNEHIYTSCFRLFFNARPLLELINYVGSGTCIATIGNRTYELITAFKSFDIVFLPINEDVIEITLTMYWVKENDTESLRKLRKTVLSYFMRFKE